MTKKQAHTIVFIGDLFFLWGVWIGIDELQRIKIELSSQVDVISYGNRIGFFVVGIGIPIIHLFTIVEHFFTDLVSKFKNYVNPVAIFFGVVLLSSGFIICSRVETKIENAGYVYCRNASGISALAKTVVYTKSMKTCDDLVKEKRERRK